MCESGGLIVWLCVRILSVARQRSATSRGRVGATCFADRSAVGIALGGRIDRSNLHTAPTAPSAKELTDCAATCKFGRLRCLGTAQLSWAEGQVWFIRLRLLTTRGKMPVVKPLTTVYAVQTVVSSRERINNRFLAFLCVSGCKCVNQTRSPPSYAISRVAQLVS